ncbi:MAG: hypothetical protein CVV32_03355 [Methanomicrobiales archaeon HGW-Methanomicrobiales-3]|nr:MAG: hypothetical protein CVV32_03355 [Methanomicrobiales archaeon HGW-Methanomicrobiales-3]
MYRAEVWQLARRAAAGDIPAVTALAGVFCTTPDPKVRERAAGALRSLPVPVQAVILCREALLRDNPALLTLVQESGHLPSDAEEQALWYFCTTTGGPGSTGTEDCLLLAAGYTRASAPVRARVRSAARRFGTCSLLGQALMGTGTTRNAGTWSYDEWEIVITGLIGDGRWEDLWLLSSLAPVPHAITALAALIDSGWITSGDDRALFFDLAATLPDRWTHPAPAGNGRESAGSRPAGQVTRLCFSPDGTLLATGSCNGTITVRHTTSAGTTAEFSLGQSSVRFLAIPNDNPRIVSSGDNGTVCCHSLTDRSLLWCREGWTGATAFALDSDVGLVFIGDDRGTLHTLACQDGRTLPATPLHPSPVTCLVPAGQTIACGHADGTISIVRPVGAEQPVILPGSGSPVRSIVPDADGTGLLVVHEEGSPVLWDLPSRKKCRTFTGMTGRVVCTAAAARWFAIGDSNRMIRVWSLDNTAPLAEVPTYNRRLTSCTAAPDGSLLACGFHEGTVRLYRMPDARLLREFRGHTKTITSCTLAADGGRLATVSWDGTTKLWRVPGGEIVRTLDAHAGGIVSLAGPAGSLVVPVTQDGAARLVDARDGTTLRTIDLYTAEIRSAALDRDGTFLASTGADASIRIWNIRDGSLAAAAEKLQTSQRCCTFLPDRPVLVTGGWDGVVRLFAVPDATPLRTLAGHTSVVTCCTVSGDGTLLVTGSNDTTVRLFRPDEDEAYAVADGFRSEVGAVALSPDGTLLAAGSSDGPVRLFFLPYATPAGELPGLPGTVTALTFTPDSCILVAGYASGTCAFFSVHDRSLIRTLPAHSGSVTGAVITADGRTLVTSGEDGLCRFHPLPHAPFLVHAGLDTIPSVQEQAGLVRGSTASAQWSFLELLLTARFRGEIEICPPLDVAGCYDIQIMG